MPVVSTKAKAGDAWASEDLDRAMKSLRFGANHWHGAPWSRSRFAVSSGQPRAAVHPTTQSRVNSAAEIGFPAIRRSLDMNNHRPVLIACCLAMLSVGDNSTAIMAALPAITHALQLAPAEVEWVVNAYLLAAAVFIVLGGDAADQFGARYSST